MNRPPPRPPPGTPFGGPQPLPANPSFPPPGCPPGADPNYCTKCGTTDYDSGSFNHICNVNAFGRCERIAVPANGGIGQSELARIQLRDSVGWLVTVSVKEITAGAVVQAKVIYGGGNVNTEIIFDVGDRVDIPVQGNSVRVVGLVSGTANASAMVCASIGRAEWGNSPQPDFYVQVPVVSGDFPASAITAVGPTRLLRVTAYLVSGAAGYLMLFDSPVVPANGTFPRWAAPLQSSANALTNGAFLNADFSNSPIAFTQGLSWAISSTGDSLTAVPADVARVDIWLSNKPDAVITTNIPDTTGPHIP